MTYRWKAQSGLTTFDFTADAIATYEASRNTDPGEANVLGATAYLIQNVSKEGSFDEAARNTDPGVANVLDGVTYLIQNVAKEGTYDPGSAPTTPTVAIAMDGLDITVTISGSDTGTTNTVYTQKPFSGTATNRGSASGDGTVEFSLAEGDYLYWVVSNIGNACAVVPGGVLHVQAARNCATKLRDKVAKAAYKVCTRKGTTGTFQNPQGDAVEVRLLSMDGRARTSLRGGFTDEHEFRVLVPRQTGFPVSTDNTLAFRPGATMTVDGVIFAVMDVEYDQGDVDMAPAFTMTLARNSRDYSL